MRAFIYKQLWPSAWDREGLSPTNKIIVCLIIAASILFVIETEPAIREGSSLFFVYAELFFTTVFSIEYVLRVWAAGENEKYRGLIGRLRFMRTRTALLDLIAVLPAYVSFITTDAYILRLFRLLRILRLAKLGRYSASLTRVVTALSQCWRELVISLCFAVLLLLFGSLALYFAERGAQPDDFGSIPRTLWWAIATVSPLSSGPVHPITPVGMIISSFLAILGVGTVALPAGILAGSFKQAFENRTASDP